MTATRNDDRTYQPTRSVPFARDLERHGDAVAVRIGDRSLTYRELASEADLAAAALGPDPGVVVLDAGNDLPSLATYLGALRRGHPVLLAPSAEVARSLADTYGSARDVHDDLALLLSTSGSTGSPKLVRLSHDNLQANAEAIATFLGLDPTERAMTSLPMHYCFGLSVINSHLAVGASVVLDDRSVVDEGFWATFRAERATSFAGVPYTFDLLDRIGFEDLALPHLRHVQQAGGKLAADRVQRYAAMGEAAGWELFVMYGQTEATARMAYLPPHLARRHPDAIGVAVPGGAFTLEPVDGLESGDAGELVYRGPNVMLGYAESPDDLALGRTVDALRTGDLARRNADGLYEIVGRRSRFVKLFGVRLDLDRIERALTEEVGADVACTGDDDRLVVGLTGLAGAGVEARTMRTLHERFGVPSCRVDVVVVDELPRLANGKVDHAALRTRAEAAAAEAASTVAAPGPAGAASVRMLFADVFPGRGISDDDTFAGLGGDSLSYVEMSVRLEETLGHLPPDWPAATVGRLEEQTKQLHAPVAGAHGSPPWARLRQVETNVVLRALAVVAVVGTHAGLFRFRGGAHLLLALAGFNFARFQLGASRTRPGGPRLARSLTRIAVPAAAWTAVLLSATDDYDLANLFLVHSHVGESHWDQRWRYWYVEAVVQILVAVALLFRVPVVRRLEHRSPFAFAFAAFAVALAWRVHLFDLGGISRPTHRPQTVLWIFLLGWTAAVARTARQKALVVAAAAAVTPAFFVDDGRSVMLVAGLALLVAVPTVRVPQVGARAAAVVASASLYVYLTHWQVYPAVLASQPPLVAVAACLAVGTAAWKVVDLSGSLRRARSRSASSAAAGATAPALGG